MIVVPENTDRWLLVTQGDHARFAAQLLASWRTPPPQRLPDFEELLFAVREHDNGWREIDAAPLLHPEGDRPHDFMTLPEPERRALWERGTARYAAHHPLASLVITEHALHLLGESEGSSGSSSPTDLAERRTELIEQTGCPDTELANLYHWLALVDWLSLVACNRWPEPFERGGLRGVWLDGCLQLEPFPLAGATTFELPVRSIPRCRYAGDGALGTAVMSARWQKIPLRVTSLER